MKLFILSDDLTGSGPVWMNIFWPHYTAYAATVPTVLLGTPYQTPGEGRLQFHWQNRQERRAYGPQLCDQVRAARDPKGPNVLIVWALNTRDIIRSRLLDPVWDEFDAKVLWILDTVNPAHVHADLIRRFDLVASICGDIGKDFETTFGLPTLYMPPHVDVLRYGTVSDYRPIDLVVIGRRLRKVYDPVHLYFNEPGRSRVSLDVLTRTNNFSASAQDECQILMGSYSRSKISFCFEPSTAHPRFRGYSPMTERWPHSWASGCTVVGTRPTGTGAAEQMDWPEATIDLPQNPDEAIPFLEALLDDSAALRQRRVRNVVETARRHDTRHRFYKLLREMDLPIPDGLSDGLGRLERFAAEISTGGA